MGSYNFILPGLAQGSVPSQDAGDIFDTVVLCAMELQDVRVYGAEVIHAPLDDANPTREEVQIAWTAAKRVARRVKAGRKVLVTCAQGRNRSGLVSGFTLIILGLSAKQAVHAIRRARENALTNPHFVRVLGAVRPA